MFIYTFSFYYGENAQKWSNCLFAAFKSLACFKDHVEEEGVIFLAFLKSYDRLQRSPFMNLIAHLISSVIAPCVSSVRCMAPVQAHIKPASLTWFK